MDKKIIQINIITPERTVISGEYYQATLPVANGLVTILPNHRSYIASLKPGEVILKEDSKEKKESSLFISGGFIEFHNNKLVILSDEAERAEEIDIEKAEEARKRAEEVQNQKNVDDSDYARVAAVLEKELARIGVARRFRSRH